MTKIVTHDDNKACQSYRDLFMAKIPEQLSQKKNPFHVLGKIPGEELFLKRLRLEKVQILRTILKDGGYFLVAYSSQNRV